MVMLGGGLAHEVVDKIDEVEIVCEDVWVCHVAFGKVEGYEDEC